MLVQELKNFGLSENEAKIYLTALVNPGICATKMSEYTRINRTSIYQTAKILESKNILTVSLINGKHCFFAKNPELLINCREDIISDHKKKIDRLKIVMPELNLLFSGKHMSGTKVFHCCGEEKIKHIYEDFINNTKEICYSLLSISKTQDLTRKYLDFLKEASDNEISHKIIIPDSEAGLGSKISNKFTQIRLLEEHKYCFSASMHCNSDHLLFITNEHRPNGISIINENRNQIFQKIFDHFWSIAGDL